MSNKATFGTTYHFELVRDGVVIDQWEQHNIVPTQGLNHVLDVVLNGAAPVTSWRVGLFEGNYTPVAADTMSTFPAAATETTAYSDSTRPALVTAAAAAGKVSNIASRAEFTFTADKLVKGGFISSSSTKGGTSGVLLSAARFPDRDVKTGDIMRVTTGIEMTSS